MSLLPCDRGLPPSEDEPGQDNRAEGTAHAGHEAINSTLRYCYPLTITDFASRYLLTCEALGTTQEKFAFTVLEQTFKEFGLPALIRTAGPATERTP